jgi:hypothetical protein
VRRVLYVFAVAALAGCGSYGTTPPQPPPATSSATTAALRQVHDPGTVTGTLTGPCHTRDGGQLPDPHCTPGSYDPAITAAILCSGNYSTSSYRPPSSQTDAFKFHTAYFAYGIPPGGVSELDHLVPLTLGGANDASNLWPEMGPVPNAKDPIEVALHKWVCAGGPGVAQGRLERAQVAISINWMDAEQKLGVS